MKSQIIFDLFIIISLSCLRIAAQASTPINDTIYMQNVNQENSNSKKDSLQSNYAKDVEEPTDSVVFSFDDIDIIFIGIKQKYTLNNDYQASSDTINCGFGDFEVFDGNFYGISIFEKKEIDSFKITVYGTKNLFSQIEAGKGGIAMNNSIATKKSNKIILNLNKNGTYSIPDMQNNKIVNWESFTKNEMDTLSNLKSTQNFSEFLPSNLVFGFQWYEVKKNKLSYKTISFNFQYGD